MKGQHKDEGKGRHKDETAGISGYVARDVADELLKTCSDDAGDLETQDAEVHLKGRGRDGTVDVKFEAGSDKIVFRVKRAHIRAVHKGATTEGETLVHLILAPNHHVETVISALRDIKRIDDPALTRLTASAYVSVSFV